MKSGKPPELFGWVLLLIWGRILSSTPETAEVLEVLLFVATIIHGIFIFSSGTLKELNNNIARSIAATINN